MFLDGLERVKVASVLDPPRIIGHGFKPMNRRQRATRTARRKVAALRRRGAVRTRLKRRLRPRNMGGSD